MIHMKSLQELVDQKIKITSLGVPAKLINTSELPNHIKPKQVRDEIPTLNQYGYMKSELEYFSNSFIERSKNASKPVLEIGTAYGWLTHKVLETGATIVAADISKEHLEVLVKDAPQEYLNSLYIKKGMFPVEMDFEVNSFDTVMASRILHFLNGNDLEKGLDKIYDWLVLGGQLIATNCSIYHSSVKTKMHQVFQERIANNEPWPGLVYKEEGIDKVHDKYSASFVHVFYKEQLEELLPKHGFKIEKINYFDYPSDPWPDEGKGHIGFIATKVEKKKSEVD